MDNYQVIIVGAGPAGSHLAFELAKRGIKTLVLEKALLPRNKCCAGGLTVRTADPLDIDIHNLAEDVISTAVVSFRGNKNYQGLSDKPFMYTIDRESFDYILAKRAQEAGAEVKQGVKTNEIRLNENGVEVFTSEGTFHCEYIVGADGSRSQVRKAMGIKKHDKYILGMQAEVKVAEKVHTRWKSEIGIDLGLIRGGYGWVFPKSDRLTIGIVGPIDKAKRLKSILGRYIDSLELGNYTVTEWSAGLLPVCISKSIVSKGRGILVGDAAGLADPLTGEGMYNAILSARLGAAAIDKVLNNGGILSSIYTDAIDSKIIPQMKVARAFSRALALLPAQFIDALNKDEGMWQACCNVLCGNLDYVAIKNRVRSIRRLYSLVSCLTIT